MNIYVVDDDSDLRESLGSFLREYDYPVQLFASAVAFLSVAQDLSPGCLLLDLQMPHLTGLELQNALCDLESHHQIILLSGFGQIPEVVQAMRSGAIDFLTKPHRPEELLRAIEDARANLLQSTQQEGTKMLLKRLSAKERSVLLASTGGKASKLVAHELNLSIRTVEKHRSSIMHKLGVQNFAGALLVMASCAVSEPNRAD